MKINNIKINKIVFPAILFSLLATSAIEGYNLFYGFDDFSIIREVNMLIINFIIGSIASYFHYKKKIQKQKI